MHSMLHACTLLCMWSMSLPARVRVRHVIPTCCAWSNMMKAHRHLLQHPFLATFTLSPCHSPCLCTQALFSLPLFSCTFALDCKSHCQSDCHALDCQLSSYHPAFSLLDLDKALSWAHPGQLPMHTCLLLMEPEILHSSCIFSPPHNTSKTCLGTKYSKLDHIIFLSCIWVTRTEVPPMLARFRTTLDRLVPREVCF